MKTSSSLGVAHLRKIMPLCILFFSLISTAQTAIINYNFDVSNITNYGKFYTRSVNGISCLLSSPTAYSQSLHFGTGSFTGTVSGASAFFANTAVTPNRIVALAGTGAGQYFNFSVSGSSIAAYNTFKVYFQARDNNTGTTTINSVQYSVDGGAFTNLATSIATTATWTEFLYNLPAISPTSTLDIRINFTSSSSAAVFGVDNFQIQAVGPSVASVAIAPNHPIATNVFANTTNNMIAAYRMDAHVSAITPSSVTLTTAGTYLATDFANFKLWQNSYNTLYGATQVGSTVAAAVSGSNLVFSSGFNSIAAGTSNYFFITADVLGTPTAGRTVNITSTAFTNITFSGSPTKIGITPVTAGNTFTVAASQNRYTQSAATGVWDNGSSVNRWGTTSGTYGGKWSQGGIANLETGGETIQIDATTGAVTSQILVTANTYNLQSTLTQVTTGLTLINTGTINVSGSNVLRMSNSAGGNGNGNPLLASYGFNKTGTGELMFSQPFSFYSGGLSGPIYINGGTFTMGDKSNTNNPNLYLHNNDFFLNNGKFTIAAANSGNSGLGFFKSLTVDGTGTNNSSIELYNTGTAASLYAEPTTDDRYPQLAIDLLPLSIKGTLSVGYGGNTNGVTSAFVMGNVNLTGNATFKTLTNGSGNLAGSSGIITNIELSGEGGRSGLYAAGVGSLGSFGVTDNGYTLTVQGGGSSASDGGYVSINGSNGTSTGAWTVGNADGSQAGYLSINDVGGLTSGSITVNQNSQLDINVSGATINIAKTPTITLNGAKTFSYYGALALYNSTAGTTSNTLNSPIVVNTSDATVGIYNNEWTLGGAITGTGGFQLYGNLSTYTLKLTSNANTWTGGTKILSGVLTVAANSSISTGPLTMAQLATFNTRVNFNNAAQTIGSLSSTWLNNSGTRVQVIDLSSGHTLTVNQTSNLSYGDGAVNTLTAVIQGAGNLIKDGAATLTLTGANTYSGLTQVKGGILRLNRLYAGTEVLPATNNVHIIGGTLQVSTNQTLNNVILSTGTLQVDNGVTLTINGTFTLVNGTINLVGTGKIAYGPSGILTYAGSSPQTSSTLEIPAANGPKGIINDNNTHNGLIINANVTGLTGGSINNGWLDFNGKSMAGTGTFTSNGLTGPYTVTGNTSASSSVVTNVSNTASLGIGMKMISASISANTFIIYIDPLVPNTVTLDKNASATSTGVTITAGWRGGLKVSMPEGIGNGTVNAHVQTTGGNVYNPGANYVFNTPTSGTTIYPAMPTVGTLNYSPAYDVWIQAGISNKVILGTSQDIEISHDLTLTSALFVTNNNLITWSNSGGVLTSPNTPYTTLSTASNNSYIAICTNTGAELTLALPYTGTKGFRIKNVGSGTDYYFPIGLNFTSANRMMLNNTGTTSDFTVAMKTGDLLLTPGSRVNRIWYVNSSVSGVTANMRLFFTKRDWSTWPSPEEEVEAGFLYNDIHLIQKNYSENFINKSQGTDVSSVNFLNAMYDNTEIYGKYTIGISADAAGSTNGITNFTRFSLVNEYIVLPVTLTNLKAHQQGNNVMVNWTALNEMNIDHYEVEKSDNGINFKTIAYTKALNNSLPQNDYGITDINPLTGNNYYRIKITGKDGVVSYTVVVFVNMGGGKTSISIQPNPVHNRVANLQISNLNAGKYQLMLYDNLGQRVYSKIIEHAGGSSSQQLMLPASIKPGTYIVKVYNDMVNYNMTVVID